LGKKGICQFLHLVSAKELEEIAKKVLTYSYDLGLERRQRIISISKVEIIDYYSKGIAIVERQIVIKQAPSDGDLVVKKRDGATRQGQKRKNEESEKEAITKVTKKAIN
jgi:hypothetical protein